MSLVNCWNSWLAGWWADDCHTSAERQQQQQQQQEEAFLGIAFPGFPNVQNDAPHQCISRRLAYELYLSPEASNGPGSGCEFYVVRCCNKLSHQNAKRCQLNSRKTDAVLCPSTYFRCRHARVYGLPTETGESQLSPAFCRHVALFQKCGYNIQVRWLWAES